MKNVKIVFASLLLTMSLVSCNASEPEQKEYDYKNLSCDVLPTYSASMNLDTDNDLITGTVDISVNNQSGESLNDIVFIDYARGLNRRGGINTIKYNDQDLEFSFNGSIYTVDLTSSPIKAGETRVFSLNFNTYPTSSSKESYCTVYARDNGEKEYALGYFMPQLAYHHNDEWYNKQYNNDTEAACYPMADFEVDFFVDDSYTLMSTGRDNKINGGYHISAPSIREMNIYCSNFCDIYEKEMDGIRYRVNVDDDESQQEVYHLMLDVAHEAITKFEDLCGEYIYDELDVVLLRDMTFASGVEYPGLIYSQKIIVNDAGASFISYGGYNYPMPYIEIFDTIAHEVGHQYFYNIMGTSSLDDGWIDEGFASYLGSVEFLLNPSEILKKYAQIDKENAKIYTSFQYNLAVYCYDPNNPEEYMNDYVYYTDASFGMMAIDVPYDKNNSNYFELIYDIASSFITKIAITLGRDEFKSLMHDIYTNYSKREITTYNMIELIKTHDINNSTDDLLETYLANHINN